MQGQKQVPSRRTIRDANTARRPDSIQWDSVPSPSYSGQAGRRIFQSLAARLQRQRSGHSMLCPYREKTKARSEHDPKDRAKRARRRE